MFIDLNVAYTEQGAIATDANLGSNTVTIAGDTVDTTTAGSYTVTYDVMDAAGNLATQLTRTVTVINTVPTLTSVSIASDNVNSAFAKAGDTATLSFTADNVVQNVSVTIAGQTATVANVSGNDWTASYTFTGNETEGVVPFIINFEGMSGTAGTQVIATTDSTSVTADFTAPVVVASDMSVTLNANGQASLQAGAALASIDGTAAASQMIYGNTRFTLQNPINGNSVTYAAGIARMNNLPEEMRLTALDAVDTTVRAGDKVIAQTTELRFGESIGRSMMYRSFYNDIVWEPHNAGRDADMRMEITQTGKSAGEAINFDQPFYLRLVSQNQYVSFSGNDVRLAGSVINTDFEVKTVLSSGDSYNNSAAVLINGLSLSQSSFSCSDVATGQQVTLTAVDYAGNAGSDTLQVTVVDNIAPVMALVGDSFMSIPLGQAFVDPGVSVVDNCNTTNAPVLTVFYSGNAVAAVDSSVGGIYKIVYDYSDGNGNDAQSITREVLVDDGAPPVLTNVSITSNNANPAYAQSGHRITLDISASKPITFTQVTIGNVVASAGDITTITPGTYSITIRTRNQTPNGIINFSLDFEDTLGQAGAQVTNTTDGSQVMMDKINPSVEVTQVVVNSTSRVAIPGTDSLTLTLDFSEEVQDTFTIDTWAVNGNDSNAVATGEIVLTDAANHIYEFTMALPASTFYPSYGARINDWFRLSDVRDVAGNRGTFQYIESPCGVVLAYDSPSNDGYFTYDGTSWSPNDPLDASNPVDRNKTIMVTAGNPVIAGDIAVTAIVVLNGATLDVQGRVTNMRHLVMDGDVSIDHLDMENVSNTSTCTGNSTLTVGTLDLSASNDYLPVGNIYVKDMITCNRLYSFSRSAKLYPYKANITLGSSATGTAYFDYANVSLQDEDLQGNLLARSKRNVTVERYFKGVRGYRFFGSTVDTETTIHDNWQEGGSNAPGYGVQITGTSGAANGFDASGTNNPSLFTYDAVSSGFVPVNSTNAVNDTLVAGNAYSLYVRGDRTNDLSHNSSTPQATVVRATGTLESGTRSFPTSAIAGEYDLVANPFQAPFDLTNMLSQRNFTYPDVALLAPAVLPNKFWTWDPASQRYYGWDTTLDIATSMDAANGGMIGHLAPGQGVFLAAAPTPDPIYTPQIQFQTRYLDVSLSDITIYNTPSYKLMDISLYQQSALASNGRAEDGLRIVFQSGWNNNKDQYDIEKFLNPGSNLARSHTGGLLNMERKDMPLSGEILPLYMDNLAGSTNYAIRVEPIDMPGIDVFIYDTYMATSTPVDRSNPTDVSFTIDPAVAASSDANRFEVRFTTSTLSSGSIEKLEGISIYPNPTIDGTFSIAFNNVTGEKEIRLTNMLGQKVYSTTSQDSREITINNLDLPAGTYVVTITIDGNKHSEKLIVQ